MRKPFDEKTVRERVLAYAEKSETMARESRLCRELRSISEEARFRILKEFYAIDHRRALSLVYWCIDNPAYCESFLREGLLKAHDTRIRLYVKFLAPKLDWESFFQVLEETLAIYPEGVCRALFWVKRSSFGESIPYDEWQQDEWQQALSRIRAIQNDERYVAAYNRMHPPQVPIVTETKPETKPEIKRDPGTTPVYRANQHSRFGQARAIQYRRVIRPKTNQHPRPETP